MKHLFSLLLISLGIFGLNTTASAQATKFGYINADSIIMLMPEAAKLQSDLQAYQQSLLQVANDKQNAFNDAVQKFIKDSSSMSQTLKDVKRQDLQRQSQDLATQQQQMQQELDAKRQELALPIQKKLQVAIEEVAKENGYTYVFNRDAMIIAPPKDDLGSLVIKKLNIKPSAVPATPVAPSGNH